jgi:hypothetical protein
MVFVYDGNIFVNEKKWVIFSQGEIRQILLGIPCLNLNKSKKIGMTYGWNFPGLKPQVMEFRICES